MEDEITIDLRELVHIVQKNARFIAKVTGGCIAVAGLYSCSRAVFAYSFTGLRIRFAAAHQAAQRDRLIAFRKYTDGQ